MIQEMVRDCRPAGRGAALFSMWRSGVFTAAKKLLAGLFVMPCQHSAPNGFLALYGDGAIEEARRQREGNWASLKTVLTGAVALGALMTVGALFASK
ncbi:hypothetical protein AB205_0060460 [Aquarana catesbeiana]|uniref:Uncharacterized protein n=1 Tax=Aquarana catesbeiana TaxID=8400 RepID=A0A2G9SAU8_AQUCT|nr:hypothetical protein AB205_0060460 [Aquarana catesbeiana]